MEEGRREGRVREEKGEKYAAQKKKTMKNMITELDHVTRPYKTQSIVVWKPVLLINQGSFYKAAFQPLSFSVCLGCLMFSSLIPVLLLKEK